jgi:nucleoside-diphosphate-sugar epimerase
VGEKMSKRYLVTGGAGFIGSNIAARLVRDGNKVRVLDNLSTGKMDNLLSFMDKIEFIQGDIRYFNSVLEAMEDIDFVLHQAALPSVPRSVQIPIESNDTNTNGTLNVLYAAMKAGVKRVVYAASSSAYGESAVLPKVETMIPSPLSPYAVNKLTGEYYCTVFHRVYGLETVVLRYFNVFGPGQDPNSYYSAVIPKFIKALLEGKSPTIFGDGEQSRDFCFIENVVHANLLACLAPKEAVGEVFNVACGERITLNELFHNLQTILGIAIPVRYAAPRSGDIKHSLADIRKAQKLLRYEVLVPVREGLKNTAEWFKSYFQSV